jgi:REP element-mobilizing transposase RayT
LREILDRYKRQVKPDINHYRKSLRLKEYDYSLPGEYYVTICTHERECILGEIFDGEMKLNARGIIADKCWREITKHFENVKLDDYLIMPNHVHGIIIITESCRDLINQIPTKDFSLMKNPKITLGKIIRHYKARTAKCIYDSGIANFKWQRGYYDRIIRNGKELNNIRDYINSNVLKWSCDTLPACRSITAGRRKPGKDSVVIDFPFGYILRECQRGKSQSKEN